MPLSAIVTPEIYNDQPDAVQDLYGEPDNEGNRIAQIEWLDQHPDKRGLLSAYKTTSAENKLQKQKLSEIQAELSKASAQGAKAKEAASSEYEAKLSAMEAALKEAQQDAENQRQALERQQIMTELDAELQRSNVTSLGLRQAAVAVLIGKASLSEGKVVVDDGYPKPVGEFIAAWSSSDGADFVSQPTGGGAKPGNGKVTVTRDDFKAMNADQRIDFLNKDPEQFKRLTTPQKE